jgi:hypothetical protein
MALNILQAIAREEGFLVPYSRAARNNNPGNINFGAFAKSFPETVLETTGKGIEPRFAHFPSVAVGYDAMKELFLMKYKGLTVTEALNKYAPPSDNNQTSSYIKNVCTWCECTPDTIIDTLIPNVVV